MTMLGRLALIALATVTCLAGFALDTRAIAGDEQGSRLAAACASCHDSDGRDAGILPVVGTEQATLVQAMLAYRSGERRSQIMQVVATALSLDEIATVATYLAAAGPAGVRR